MSYPIKYRKRTIEYRREGHTLDETMKTFKVLIPTIRKWETQLKEKGNLENKPLNRGHKKLDPEKLTEYITQYPDAYLIEIAEVFGCSDTAVSKALKKLGYTRKKRQSVFVNKTKKGRKISL